MSPLWRDEIGVFVASRRILLVRLGRGLRPRPTAQLHCPVTSAARGWEPAVAVLREQLRLPEWSNAAVRLVVGDQWVRYAVVPWSQALGSAAERAAHARELLGEIFGHRFEDWRITLSDAPPGAAKLACAMPVPLRDALEEAIAGGGRRLLSITPQLIAAYNGWRHRFGDDGHVWFVSVEPGSLAALRVGARGVNRVHSVRTGAEWGRELKRLQTVSRALRASPADGRVFVDVPHALRASLDAVPAELEWLDDPTPPPTTLNQLAQLRRSMA